MAKRIYNQTSLFGPLYAYLVVLSPPPDIKAKVAAIKEELNKIADISDRNVRSIAHITLTDKLTDDADVAEKVKLLVGTQPAFTVLIQGWGYFDHGHSVTVYLNVVNPAPVVHLAELLKSSARAPHISLAKRIPHSTFNSLKPYLENLTFEAEWQCNEVTVLRKLMTEKHLGWRESFKIPFKK